MSVSSVGIETIHQTLINAGVNPDVIAPFADDMFALPSENWIANEFSIRFASFRDEHVGFFRDTYSDCDDFSLAAQFLAEEIHRKTKDKPEGAVAFGRFWYTPRQVLHAINIAICRRTDGLIYTVFYEPQKASIIRLTAEQIVSCSFVQL